MDSFEKGREFETFQVELEFEGDSDSLKNLSHTLKLIGVEPADTRIKITRDRPLTGFNYACVSLALIADSNELSHLFFFQIKK